MYSTDLKKITEIKDTSIMLVHTLGIIWLLNELYISFPIPEVTESGSSVIIEATILAVQLSFITEISEGMNDGRVSLRRFSFLEALYVTKRFLKSSGIFLIESLMAMATGNRVKSVIMNIFVPDPYPSIAAITGANAGTGII